MNEDTLQIIAFIVFFGCIFLGIIINRNFRIPKLPEAKLIKLWITIKCFIKDPKSFIVMHKICNKAKNINNIKGSIK